MDGQMDRQTWKWITASLLKNFNISGSMENHQNQMEIVEINMFYNGPSKEVEHVVIYNWPERGVGGRGQVQTNLYNPE